MAEGEDPATQAELLRAVVDDLAVLRRREGDRPGGDVVASPDDVTVRT